MKIIVDNNFYENGYRLTGEGRRLDIIDSENNKYCEIFFLPEGRILVMDEDEFYWVEDNIITIDSLFGCPIVM